MYTADEVAPKTNNSNAPPQTAETLEILEIGYTSGQSSEGSRFRKKTQHLDIHQPSP